ncbi:MAG TPA: hypothetical protein VK629_01995 [Steroidobacteraceae bacterium]|nr:hypothetical protein [Steroidobacteraceae bacterium]
MADYRQNLLAFGVQPHSNRLPLGLAKDAVLDAQRTRRPTPGTLGINDAGTPISVLPQFGSPAVGGKPAEDTFKLAIDLFRVSAHSKDAMGKRILKLLEDSHRTSKLKYEAIFEAGISSRSTGEITISDAYSSDIANTSIWIVHEAYHLVVKDAGMAYVDEEIESRIIQGRYAGELYTSGLTLPDGKKVKLKSKPAVLEAYERDQIIDFAIHAYKAEDDFGVTEKWIVANKAKWGGFKNRTLESLQFYANVLVDSQPTGKLNPMKIDGDVAATLLELLEARPFEESKILVGMDMDEVKAVLESVPSTHKTRYEVWKKSRGL